MTIDEIKQKYNRDEYALDISGSGVIAPNYQFKTNVGKRLGAQRGNGRVMTIQQYGKPQKVIVKKDGAGFSVVTRHGERIYRQSFKTYEDAFKLARKDGFMVVKDSVDEMQNDAAVKKSIGGEGLRLRNSAQKAVDAVVAATRKAKAACDAYSKALQKAKGPNAAWTTVDFEGIMDDIKFGGSPKVW